jgi:hypothetical protein
MRMELDLHSILSPRLTYFSLSPACDRKGATGKKKRGWKMIVCISPNPNHIARLLDYSVNFTAR